MNRLGLRHYQNIMNKTGRPENQRFTTYIGEFKDKSKSGERSGVETDQTEHLDALLDIPSKVLNKNCDTEEADTSTTAKYDYRSLSPFDSKHTQTEIVMAKKRDTNLITS